MNSPGPATHQGVSTFNGAVRYWLAVTPTVSAGSVASYSTNNGGAITGLSAATTATLTFNGTPWLHASFCSASPSVSLAAAPYVSAISTSSVTFTFPSLTGTLYYHCDGD
jgi:hypothetical protein